MPGKLRAALAGAPGKPRVIIADRQPWIGSDMGEEAREVIDEALSSLGVEQRPGVSVAAIDEDGATLVERRAHPRGDDRLVRRHAGASADRTLSGRARPVWPHSG